MQKKDQMTDQLDGELIPFPKPSNESLIDICDLKTVCLDSKQKDEEVEIELVDNRKALETLVEKISKIKSDTQQKIAAQLNTDILPLLEEIKIEKRPERTKMIAEITIKKLKMIIPSSDNPYVILKVLTPMEMRIASMIKDGYKSSDIAYLQFISLDTVKTHRGNIRKKLGIRNKQINLSSYLKSIFR